VASRLDEVSQQLVRRLTERVDDSVDELNRNYESALLATVERRRIDLPVDDQGRLVGAPLIVARVSRGFERLEQAETILLEEHVERVRGEMVGIIDLIDAGYARLGADPLESDPLVLSTLVRDAQLERLQELTRYDQNLIRDALMRSVLGRATPSDLEREFRQLAGGAAHRADRLHHDALITHSRAVNAERAEASGIEWFVYAGPDDSRNRPFCEERVGKAYAREQIDEMNNGQMPDVMRSGGGHRCRHHWRPVRRRWFSRDEWAELTEDAS